MVAALGGGPGLNPYRDDAGPGLTTEEAKSRAVREMDAFFGWPTPNG